MAAFVNLIQPVTEKYFSFLSEKMERDSLLGLISILKCLGSFGLKKKYHGQLYNKTEEYKLISKSSLFIIFQSHSLFYQKFSLSSLVQRIC